MYNALECTGYEFLIDDIDKAIGYYLYDSKGNKYIDFEAGVWCTSLGHNNLEFNIILKGQIDKITHCGFRYTNRRVTTQASTDIIKTLNDFKGKCLFLSSGSEAVEFSIKIGKYLRRNKKILTFKESYLSAFGSGNIQDENQWIQFQLHNCIGCKSDCLRCKLFNDIPFEDIGAFVFEPGNSGGLVLLPPYRLIESLEKKLRDNNCLIIVDEVTTGVGRTGKWYGFQHYNLKPDIIAIGKGIGNGYPVSVVVMQEQIITEVEKLGIRYSQSHQNDALACVVVSAVIKIINNNQLINQSSKNGQYLKNRLNRLKEKTDVIKEVRGIGMMIAVEFNDKEFLQGLDKYLFKRRIIVGCKPDFSIIRLYPSLITNTNDIDYLLECLEEYIKEKQLGSNL